jgi:hypothetical protein
MTLNVVPVVNENIDCKQLIARIRPGNEPSRKAVAKAGFTLTDVTEMDQVEGGNPFGRWPPPPTSEVWNLWLD